MIKETNCPKCDNKLKVDVYTDMEAGINFDFDLLEPFVCTCDWSSQSVVAQIEQHVFNEFGHLI